MLTAKFLTIWHWWEVPDSVNFYFFRLRAPILAALGVPFIALVPLAAAGLASAWPRRTALPALLAYLLACIPAMLIHAVAARYRIMLASALIPFAAHGVVALISWLRAGDRRRLLLWALLAALYLAWASRPLPQGLPAVRPGDFQMEAMAAESSRSAQR